MTTWPNFKTDAAEHRRRQECLRISTKGMGGAGSGGYRRTTRRQVELCFAVRVGDVLSGRPSAGHEAVLALRAPLMTWACRCRVLIRKDDRGFVATIWVAATWGDIRTDVRFVTQRVPSGGIRRYFTCPPCGCRATVLYWPFNDGAGLACRTCHGLAYRSSKTRSSWPGWMQRLAVAANDRPLPDPRP